jgi:hypothetical protein
MLNAQRPSPKARAESPKPGEHGVALVIVLLILVALGALGSALVLLTATERRVSAVYRDSMATSYAVEGAVERVLHEVGTQPDINSILAGGLASALVDGPPGIRTLPDGTSVDLRQITGVVNCGAPVCSDADLDAETDERPWGRNNPRWQLFAHGAIAAIVPDASEDPPAYIVVWIADDRSETDGLPLVDGDETTGKNPGRGRLLVLAHAYGPSGTRRVLEITIARGPDGVRVLVWRENP